jgi:hypothetical protein
MFARAAGGGDVEQSGSSQQATHGCRSNRATPRLQQRADAYEARA